MNTVSPALASVAQSVYMQSSGLSDHTAKDPKIQDKTTASSSSAGNTTVTLAEKSSGVNSDYADLAVNQTVNSRNSVENSNVTNSELSNGTMYASSLQAQSNYYAMNQDKE